MNRPADPDLDAPYVPSKGLTSEGLWWLLLLIAVAVVGAAIVIAMFARGAWVNSPDLQTAVLMNPGDIVPLIRAGADPNAVDPATGETPLSLAIMLNNRESVRLLLENGADPNLGGMAGVPVLVSAYLNYHDPRCVAIVELLIEHGADVNGQDASHQSALHRAAEFGNLRLLEFLITEGADIDAISDYGTALHFARRGGHTPLVESLIRAGADEWIPDPGGAGGSSGSGFY